MRKLLLLSLFCVLCCPQTELRAAMGEAVLASIQSSVEEMKRSMASLQITVQQQNEIIERQAIKIEALENGQILKGQSDATVTTTGAPASGETLQRFPDIEVAGTVQAKLTESKEDTDGNDAIALKELELNFSQAVDSYSRVEAIFGFNDNLENQNADIEEAYYTRWGLPLGFSGQIGKFRSKIGKQNLLHLHQLSTADYPLVLRDFFGDEGLASSGARLQNLIPNPWDVPVEITGEILRGNNGNSFSGVSRRPIFNTHAKTFFQTSQDTNLELGWTTLFGDENPPQFSGFDENGNVLNAGTPEGRNKYGVKVYGADATFNWLLPEDKAVKFHNEIYFQRRGSLAHVNDDPWGFYTLLDYRFSPRFSAGVRFDYLQPLDVTGHRESTQISPYLVFYQNEFADFKIQYSHLDPASTGARSDNMVYLQADFLIGAHEHAVP